MKRSTVGLMLVLMLTVGTSARAQEEDELASLDLQLDAVARLFGAIVDQYDRILEQQFDVLGGLDAWWNLDRDAFGSLVSSAAERLEARTPGRGSALVEFLAGIDLLLKGDSTLRRTLPALIDKFRQWFGEDPDEATIRSIRIEVRYVRAILTGIKADLLRLQNVLDRIESELDSL